MRMRLAVAVTVCFALSSVSNAAAASSPWSQGAPLPAPVAYPGVAAVHGTVYAVGGSEWSTPQARVWAYRTASDLWEPRAPLPAPVAYPMLVSCQGSLYLLNAVSGNGIHESLRYAPSANRWTTIRPLPTTAAGVAASTADGRIFVVTRQHLYRYRLATGRWKTLDTDVPAAVSLDAAVVGEDGRLYLFGANSYSWVRGGGWRRLPEIPLLTADEGLSGAETAVPATGGRLMVIGGVVDVPAAGQSFPEGQTWLYDPRSRTWSRGSAGSSNGAAAVVGSRVYIVGGSSVCLGCPGDEVVILSLGDSTPPTALDPPYPAIAGVDRSGARSSVTAGGAVPVAPVGSAVDGQTGVEGENGWLQTGSGPYRNRGWWPYCPTCSLRLTGGFLPSGETGRWSARWSDSLGNLSHLQAGPSFTAAIIGDSSGRIVYHGDWTTTRVVGELTAPLGGVLHLTARQGASATLTFTGRSVAYLTPWSDTLGVARVSVDNDVGEDIYVAPNSAWYDYYSPTDHAILYTHTWKRGGTHTIKVVAAYGSVALDGFAVLR